MEADRFWALVEGATPGVRTDPDGFEEALTHALRALTIENVVAFGRAWHAQALRAYDWDVWAAAWVIRGCRDSGFLGFRDRLIALGRETFERALADADTLAELSLDWTAGDVDDDDGNAWLCTATLTAYEDLAGRLPPDAEDDDSAEPQEPSGCRWDMKSVAARVPRVAAKYAYDPRAVRLLGPCPCCGCLTIDEPGAYSICDVCWWEDDDVSRERTDLPRGNGISLDEARANYRRFGASDPRSLRSARPPRPWELPSLKPTS